MQKSFKSIFNIKSLRAKLFLYMTILAAIILAILLLSLFFLNRFNTVQNETQTTMDMQLEVLYKEISTYYDTLALLNIQLAEDITDTFTKYENSSDTPMETLMSSADGIEIMESLAIPILKQKLFQADCSGVYFMLDTSISGPDSKSKAGLYLQLNGYDTNSSDILLYRGFPSVGKSEGANVHRKWKLEFQSSLTTHIENIVSKANADLDMSYSISDISLLPGTSERVMLMTVPLKSSDGNIYGSCGFELCESYFKKYFAQPSRLAHMSYLLCQSDEGTLMADEGFSSGVSGGYYLPPVGSLVKESEKSNGLSVFSGEKRQYVGITSSISLSPNNDEFTIAVLMPKSDYDNDVLINTLQITFLIFLLLFFAIICCLVLSKQFVIPIIHNLEQIKSGARHYKKDDINTIHEFHDLFEFLENKDRLHEEEILKLEEKSRHAKEEIAKLYREIEINQTEYEKNQSAIKSIMNQHRHELDLSTYHTFAAGLQTLTPTEKRIFDLYLAGHNVSEIQELINIKESTLRFHNRNIYSKLGINSLKQLKMYAAYMKETSDKSSKTH